ncbi:hypothetical protein Ga0080559_TMP4551 [Salipiger profundus]|uniref:Uncharacterized protein n=1 Tax=Salipiger profundus TaxID=1229727 RepID=A0A1U7DAZ6_9RHOB|nr:hypothetical protein Ga0080559_TMP4551 [Salipiger profundus]
MLGGHGRSLGKVGFAEREAGRRGRAGRDAGRRHGSGRKGHGPGRSPRPVQGRGAVT